MKVKKRLEITLETHELTIVRFARHRARDFCAVCRTYTPHFSTAETIGLLGLSELSVYRLSLSGRIHSRETPDGRLALCGRSLGDLRASAETPE